MHVAKILCYVLREIISPIKIKQVEICKIKTTEINKNNAYCYKMIANC